MRKAFRVVSLTITLTLLIIALVFNLTSKQVIAELNQEVWKVLIPESVRDKEESVKYWVQDIVSQEEVNNFINEFIDPSIVDKVKDKVNETKESTEKEIQSTFDKFIEEQEKNLKPRQRFVIKIYRFISDAKLKGILMILIGINILLLALAEKSFYKWMKDAFFAMLFSGLLILLFEGWLSMTVASFIKINMNFNSLITPGWILICSASVLNALYFILSAIITVNKKEKKKEKEENEVS